MAYRKSYRTSGRKSTGRRPARSSGRRTGRGGTGTRARSPRVSAQRIRIELVTPNGESIAAARPNVAGLTQVTRSAPRRRAF